MTQEEAELAARALYRAGWRHTYIFGNKRHGYHVRARKSFTSHRYGRFDEVVQIDDPEDLGPHLREDWHK